MYEENKNKKKINVKGMVFKVLIIFAVLFVVLWIFPIGGKNDNEIYSDEFKNNVSKLKEVGSKYFDNDNLPKKTGDSIKVNLDELVKSNKIEELSVNDNDCDNNLSYIKIIKKNMGYELETTLVCGEEANTSYTYLGCLDDCEVDSSTTTTTTNVKTTKKSSTKKTTTTTISTTSTTSYVKYAVIFNKNMGSDVHTIYVKKGDKAIRPMDPVRYGYKFIGWYLNDELYNFDSIVDDNIVLIAMWERI